jgi:hypothetical protein
MEKLNSIDLTEFNKLIENDNIEALLEALRTPLLRLSELHHLKILKPVFNQWKRDNLLNSLLRKSEESENTKWQIFSLLDIVILQIVRILWDKKTENSIIKSIVDELLDGQSLNDCINHILLNAKVGQVLSNNPAEHQAGLLSYLVRQKQANPQLFLVTHIEALLVGALKHGRPFSILVFEDGKIDILFTPILFNTSNQSSAFEVLDRSFENIPVTKLLKNALSMQSSAQGSDILNPENRIVIKFIEKGYSFETINRLFVSNQNHIAYEEMSLPHPNKVSIEQLVRANSTQDIFIQIRDGLKKNITVIKYKKVKHHEK